MKLYLDSQFITYYCSISMLYCFYTYGDETDGNFSRPGLMPCFKEYCPVSHYLSIFIQEVTS